MKMSEEEESFGHKYIRERQERWSNEDEYYRSGFNITAMEDKLSDYKNNRNLTLSEAERREEMIDKLSAKIKDMYNRRRDLEEYLDNHRL